MGYMGFDKLKGSLAKKGVRDPGAVAASIGRKKYGAKAFNHAAATGTKMKGMSHLPAGVSLSPQGDIAAHRAAEAHELGTFRQAPDMTKARMGWKSASPRTEAEGTKGPYGTQRMDGSGRSDSVGRASVRQEKSMVPQKSSRYVFEKLPTTGVPQGLYHPIRGEGPPGNSGA